MRDIKKEFKEIVRVAKPNEKIWMSGYLEANIDEDTDPLGLGSPVNPLDKTDQPSILKSKSGNESFLSVAEGITHSDNQNKKVDQSFREDFNQNSSIKKQEDSSGNVATLTPSTPVIGVATSFSSQTIHIIFGTETGNSKKVAGALNQSLKKEKIKTKLSSTTQYKASDLAKEDVVIVIVSTHGDGEPPEAARKFYNDLKVGSEQLSNLHYAVLALGDSSYPLFCQTGKDIDNFLESRGAKKIFETGLCDADYEDTANLWVKGLLDVFRSGVGGMSGGASSFSHTSTPDSANLTVNDSLGTNFQSNQNSQKSNSKRLPTGIISKNISLTDSRASKEIRHIEITTDEEISYLPGDSVGIFPKNDPLVVQSILKRLGWDAEDSLIWRNQSYTAKDLFSDKVSIRYLSDRFLRSYENLSKKKIGTERLDLIDLLTEYPLHDSIPSEELLGLLEPLPPRYYSLASSPEAHGHRELHITVADVDILAPRRTYKGLCSGNLFEMEEGERLEFRILKNDNFRIPESEQNAIYIGPGTGIAPFRSFLYERDSLGHTGKNWLFFGNRNFSYDFLYHSELLEFFDNGVLNKINTAFSRDNGKKVYVQDKLWENRRELVHWIEEGALIYVCGSKDPMSHDVDAMLINIFHDKWKYGKKEAGNYLDSLKESDRYKKDVY